MDAQNVISQQMVEMQELKKNLASATGESNSAHFCCKPSLLLMLLATFLGMLMWFSKYTGCQSNSPLPRPCVKTFWLANVQHTDTHWYFGFEHLYKLELDSCGE
jgi:hypothetical protein